MLPHILTIRGQPSLGPAHPEVTAFVWHLTILGSLQKALRAKPHNFVTEPHTHIHAETRAEKSALALWDRKFCIINAQKI